MEYLEGASLKDLIDRGLEAPQALAMIRQILSAAQFAHSKGIVHRDLKPQNVIVSPQGKVTGSPTSASPTPARPRSPRPAR